MPTLQKTLPIKKKTMHKETHQLARERARATLVSPTDWRRAAGAAIWEVRAVANIIFMWCAVKTNDPCGARRR